MRLRDLESRQEEITRLNKAAYQRAEMLRTADTRRIENARAALRVRDEDPQLRQRARRSASCGKEGEIETPAPEQL